MSARRNKTAEMAKPKIQANIHESIGGTVQTPAPPGDAAPPILPTPFARNDPQGEFAGLKQIRHSSSIPVDRIEPDPDQVRKEFDSEKLQELADSLTKRGQLQPIRVYWDAPAGVYRILLGERRWRAAKLAKLERLDCLIHQQKLDPEQIRYLQLEENAKRVDLKPIEQARAYRAMQESLGMSARQIAEELSVSPAAVTNALGLLKLPEPIQAEVEAGRIAPSSATEIRKLPPDQQAEAAAAVVAGEPLAKVRERRKPTPKKTTGAGGSVYTLNTPATPDSEARQAGASAGPAGKGKPSAPSKPDAWREHTLSGLAAQGRFPSFAQAAMERILIWRMGHLSDFLAQGGILTDNTGLTDLEARSVFDAIERYWTDLHKTTGLVCPRPWGDARSRQRFEVASGNPKVDGQRPTKLATLMRGGCFEFRAIGGVKVWVAVEDSFDVVDDPREALQRALRWAETHEPIRMTITPNGDEVIYG